MSQTRDELEVFAKQQRLHRIKPLLMATLFAFGCYLGYGQFSTHVGRITSSESGQAVDDPRFLFEVESSPDQQPVLETYRQIFAHEFPTYVDEVRKFRKRNARTPGEDNGKIMAQARRDLIDSLEGDAEFLSAIDSLIQWTEDFPEKNETRIRTLFEELSQVMVARRLPFLLEGEIIDEQVPALRVRFYERLARKPYRIDDETIDVDYRERLDLTNLYRDPDKLLQDIEPAVINVRAVLTSANLGVLAALHPDGVWPLSRIHPSEALSELEHALARTVYDQWRKSGDALEHPTDWQAMERVSKFVADRNDMFRTINHRDPTRLVMLEPSSIRLNWNGEAWLTSLEPYALKGHVRLMLEDISDIRAQDTRVAEDIEVAATGLRRVLLEQIRLATLAEVKRVYLKRKAPALSESFVAEVGIEAAGALQTRTLIYLAQLIEPSVACGATVAEMTSQIVDSGNVGNSRWLLLQLAQLPDTADETRVLPDALAAIGGLSCETLASRARELHNRFWGDYPPIKPVERMVADVVRPAMNPIH